VRSIHHEKHQSGIHALEVGFSDLMYQSIEANVWQQMRLALSVIMQTLLAGDAD